MAKIKDLVDQSLDNVESQKKEELTFTPISVFVSGFSRPARFKNRNFGYFSQKFIDFPPSQTDQTHVLSLSEQVRRGQGDADEPDKKQFDFPDGKDDGSEAHGIFEFAERADLWLAEQNLSEELRDSFRSQVLQQQADKAMKESISKAQENQTKKVSENAKEENSLSSDNVKK